MLKNKIIKISVPIKKSEAIIKKAKKEMVEEIHLGEIESIAALLLPEYKDYFFCTSDKPAVFTAYINGVADRLVSFEKCLINAGIRKNLNYQYTEEALNRWRAEAIQRFNLNLFKE